MKWVLNAISTGAHVVSGKVLGNRMIDLKVRYSRLPLEAPFLMKPLFIVNTHAQLKLTPVHWH